MPEKPARRRGFGGPMQVAQAGQQAKIHYTIRLQSGEVVGTSKTGMPLVFRIGKGDVIKGLEQGVIGMQLGESRTIEIPPAAGYGARNDGRVLTLKREELPADLNTTVGRTVQYMTETGNRINLVIAAVGEDTVTLDANHPFAGQTLLFDVTLLALS
jgi:FKBP-type peptidyl-prolyl cis-trans isomerase 2